MELPSRRLIHDGDDELERTRRERDLYLRLLQLGFQADVSPLLRDALALIADVVGARLAYVELRDETAGVKPMRWSAAQGGSDDEVDGVRAAISGGVIAEALATGRTVATASALLDPRFSDRVSVRARKIEAVICVPIELETPLGVLYLQRHAGAGPFSDEERENVELFAHHLAPIAERLLARQRRAVDATRPVRDTLRCDGVVGRSRALAELLQQVAHAAPLDISVLLTGCSGTGKSQIARVIHDNSPRAHGPFVELNCGALPETLVESELFGSMPGAHSTALRRMEGKVAAAEKGTLFLDEIGDLTLPAQAKLLQLLHSRTYYPLGSNRPVTADVRLITATNVDLATAVAERRFREDLFYRLQVLPLRMPSLCERREDIAELARFFCRSACARHNLPPLEMSVQALRAAEVAPWPGNIRQLQHAAEAAAIRAVGERSCDVQVHHLFPDTRGEASAPAEDASELTFQEATRRFQSRFLRDALDANGWNVVQVAQRLELARSHLYTLIRSFGLKRC